MSPSYASAPCYPTARSRSGVGADVDIAILPVVTRNRPKRRGVPQFLQVLWRFARYLTDVPS
jgi:hypothetical protein